MVLIVALASVSWLLVYSTSLFLQEIVFRKFIPREARLINLSGRVELSRTNLSEKYIYIYVYIFEGVRTMTSDCLALSGAKFAYIEKNMRA